MLDLNVEMDFFFKEGPIFYGNIVFSANCVRYTITLRMSVHMRNR